MPWRIAGAVPRGHHPLRLAGTRLRGDRRGAESADRDRAIAASQGPTIADRASAAARRPAGCETVPHMNREKTNTEEKELLSALRTLAREEEGLGTPPRVEGRLMRALDETRTVRSRHQRMFAGHALKAAAVFVLAVLGGYWWSGGGAEPPSEQAQFLNSRQSPSRGRRPKCWRGSTQSRSPFKSSMFGWRAQRWPRRDTRSAIPTGTASSISR